jgi:hypothetical protein
MNIERQTAYYIVALALFCAVVVGAMVYYGSPLMIVNPPPIARSVASAPTGHAQKQDTSKTSRAIMQKGYEEEEHAQVSENLRNPFLWTDELKPKVQEKKEAPPPVETEPPPPPRLGMIIVTPDMRLAFLDERPVREGERCGSYRLEKIAPKAVVLSIVASGRRVQLISPRNHFGPAELKREERKDLEKQ